MLILKKTQQQRDLWWGYCLGCVAGIVCLGSPPLCHPCLLLPSTSPPCVWWASGPLWSPIWGKLYCLVWVLGSLQHSGGLLRVVAGSWSLSPQGFHLWLARDVRPLADLGRTPPAPSGLCPFRPWGASPRPAFHFWLGQGQGCCWDMWPKVFVALGGQ